MQNTSKAQGVGQLDERDKLSYTVDQFLKATGISRWLFYKEVNAGRIRIVKVGKRTLIPATDARAWFERLRAASGPAAA